MLKMSEGMQEILLAVGIACIMFAIFALSACNPSLPKIKDYSDDMYPCYLADKCVTINGFKDANSQECGVAIQKCFRYTDYKRCGDDKDCWEKVGIRY
jgi:hypothetical protein